MPTLPSSGKEGPAKSKGNSCLWVPVQTGKDDKTEITVHYFISFLSKLLIKSFASSEISSNASSSKSQVAEVTLAKVSLSLSPMNGDSPLTLGDKNRGADEWVGVLAGKAVWDESHK